MSDRPGPSLFEELKRRKVWRVATFYAAAAFVVWQVADIALPALGLPETAMTWLVVLAIAGFPIAVGLAWVFELTPEGVKRTSELDAIDPAAGARAPTRPRFVGRASFVAAGLDRGARAQRGAGRHDRAVLPSWIVSPPSCWLGARWARPPRVWSEARP